MNNNQNGINNPYYKHGEARTRLYKLWIRIKERCFNPNKDNYKNYGDRGITICPEWAESYIVFRDWALNNGYSEVLQINRIENNGNYEPTNCNFVTHKENMRNTRHCKITMVIANKIRAEYKPHKYTQKQLAEKYNVKILTIFNIINNKSWV